MRGVHLTGRGTGLCEPRCSTPSPSPSPTELGDDDEDEADRERNAQAGEDRGERGGQVDAVDALQPADVQHPRGVAQLRRQRADALDGVDEHGEEDAERDHRDRASRRPTPRSDDRDRHDRDQGSRPQELDRADRACASLRGEAPMTSPIAMADCRTDREPDGEPAQARRHVREELRARPDVPGARPAPRLKAARRNESCASAPTPPRSRARRRRPPVPRAGRDSSSAARRSSPAQNTTRRSPSLSSDVDGVPEEAGEDCRCVQLRQPIRVLLLCMYEPIPALPARNSAVTHTRSAIDALTLMPVAMLGSAAGTVTRDDARRAGRRPTSPRRRRASDRRRGRRRSC